MKKERLDQILWKYGYVDSVEKAKRLIMLGNVLVDDKKIEKAGTMLAYHEGLEIRMKGQEFPYVGRGGLKLKKAIDSFALPIKGARVLDVGASTGGFSDCALQEGASFIYAVDVGSNQLAWKLRQDSRVKSMEQKHIRDVSLQDLDGKAVDVIVMDVSFISIRGIFSYLYPFLQEKGKLMVLIKPQFEVERVYLEKGIVLSLEAHRQVLEEVREAARREGFYLEKLATSPILGGKGNVEYISCFQKKENENQIEIETILEQAKELGGLQ